MGRGSLWLWQWLLQGAAKLLGARQPLWRETVGWELVLVLTPFRRATPTWVKCCQQHWWVSYLWTGVKTFYKYQCGRRAFPELLQWGGHCVCSGSPSSMAQAALQLCKGTPRGLSRDCVGLPCSARASSSLALAVGAAQEALDQLGTSATGRQHLPTLPFSSP